VDERLAGQMIARNPNRDPVEERLHESHGCDRTRDAMSLLYLGVAVGVGNRLGALLPERPVQYAAAGLMVIIGLILISGWPG
jgi:predicted MFS family arabinose efflux permease